MARSPGPPSSPRRGRHFHTSQPPRDGEVPFGSPWGPTVRASPAVLESGDCLTLRSPPPQGWRGPVWVR
eukprot:2278879-Pyramimonas_sp.AAC.1